MIRAIHMFPRSFLSVGMEILQNAPPLKTPAVTYALAAKFPCYAFNGARVKAQSLGNFCQRQDGIRGVHCLQTFRV